jgi:hypothetical protein
MHPDFEKNGYFVARDFLDDTTIKLASVYFDFKYRLINYSEDEKSKFNQSKVTPNGDVAESYTFYSDHLIESIHLNYGQLASKILRMRLSPTYTFARIYEKDSYLEPHLDRASCEVSATCPITTIGEAPSTIFISNYKVNCKPDRLSLEEVEQKGDYSEVNLYPGDVLFYRGCERYHWRKPLKEDYLIQFFMHFIETDGVHKDMVFDRRPYSGFPEEYRGSSNYI